MKFTAVRAIALLRAFYISDYPTNELVDMCTAAAEARAWLYRRDFLGPPNPCDVTPRGRKVIDRMLAATEPTP